MQNQYTGDIGDFGKLGLLRFLRSCGLTIGVNWYLVPDEKHTGDGRHVQYLEDESICQCDEELWLELKSIVNSERRKVPALQNVANTVGKLFQCALLPGALILRQPPQNPRCL